MCFGGIWGGQLQKYRDNSYAAENVEPPVDAPALGPRIARLSADMKQFEEAPREITILDETGKPLLAGDHARRYFEGPWLHKYRGLYYLSYSTGNTHLLCHAIADNPYGPYTYQGVILTPVIGWTTHHSIVEFDGKWWLFYHDAILSGATHLRCIKLTQLRYDAQDRIVTLHPYGK
jgi:Glycosyl hydrolases family 43